MYHFPLVPIGKFHGVLYRQDIVIKQIFAWLVIHQMLICITGIHLCMFSTYICYIWIGLLNFLENYNKIADISKNC